MLQSEKLRARAAGGRLQNPFRLTKVRPPLARDAKQFACPSHRPRLCSLAGVAGTTCCDAVVPPPEHQSAVMCLADLRTFEEVVARRCTSVLQLAPGLDCRRIRLCALHDIFCSAALLVLGSAADASGHL